MRTILAGIVFAGLLAVCAVGAVIELTIDAFEEMLDR